MNEDLLGKRVRVYRNLHTGNFSVQDAKTGLVIAHTDAICLSDVKFVVRKSGREKVLREKRKNVHAFVVGYVSKSEGCCSTEAGYNPYSADHFYRKDNGNPLHVSARACLKDNKIFI